MIPTNKSEFKDWCLRKLGMPVMEVVVDDDQVDDRIDEAVSYFNDYHFDGTEKVYFRYQIAAQDIANRYVQVPDNVIGVVNVFPVGSLMRGGDMFSIRYQIALNDLYTLTSVSMVPYFMTMQHLELMEQLLVGQAPLRYNRVSNRLYVDMDWSRVAVGEYLVAEAYQVVDPAAYPKMWGNRWLLNYACALVKEQYGTNIKKYGDAPLPGGVKFNGQKIYDEGHEWRLALEKEMIGSWSLPSTDMIG